jgi:ADP-ribose pyrophosphatase YjhB (NUDIX family)
MKSDRSSGVILKYGEKVLLCKRADHETYAGKWFIPSGHLEKNETPRDCAYREFYEETNIKIEEEISLVGFITKKNEEGKPKGLIYVYLYESDEKTMPNLDKAEDGHEHSDCGFFTIEDLPIDENEELFKILTKILS